MARTTFPKLVERFFRYLADDYGFSVREHVYGSEPFSDGVIEFWSKATVVSIRLDRGQVAVLLGPSTEPEIARLSLETVIEFLTGDKETPLTNPAFCPGAIESRVTLSLSGYAIALREYCGPVLRGDFSWWLEALKYFLAKMQENYRSLTGLELPESERFAQYVRSLESRGGQGGNPMGHQDTDL